MSFARKMFPGISEIIVGVKNWCDARFSLLGHSHAPDWNSKVAVFETQDSAYINSSSYGSVWTAPATGFLLFFLHNDGTTSTDVTMIINNSHEFMLTKEGNNAYLVNRLMIPIGKDDTVQWKRTGNLTAQCNCTFVPYK